MCLVRANTDAPPRKWLFIAAVPLVIDYSLELFEIWNNTHSSRLLTGGLLGAVAVFYVMPGLIDLGLRLMGGKLTPRSAATPAFPDVLPSNPGAAPTDYNASQ